MEEKGPGGVRTPPPEVPGYDLAELVGRGGSGEVWAASRQRDGAPVAVKVVPLGTDAQARVAARELAVLARVEVDGLVGFHEAVGLTGAPPALAVVLDRVRGGSLARVVEARGHLTVGETVTVLAPVARTLAGLHALGVVHGDVSPGNILLELTGRPLLSDLGVAAVAGAGVGEAWGTPGFVAPEVLDGEEAGPAGDVYAVGALAWWCATGTAPDPGPLRPSVEEVLPDLPEAWRRLTSLALSGDPRLRPSAAELALGYFDAAPCEPLRLTVGSDETSLLTQRIRDTGEPPPTGEEAVARSRHPGRRIRALLGGVAARRTRRSAWSAPRGRAVAVVLALAVAAAVLVPAGIVVAAGGSTPGWLPSVPRSTGPRQPARPTPSSPVTDPVSDRRAPQRDPHALLQALADERAAVMNAGDPDRLEALDAPGSQVLRQDTAALRELVGRGQRYAGVRLTADRVRLVSASGTRATLEAAVDTAAYELVGGGRVEQRPATSGRPLRFVLGWHDARWKVDSVADARPVP
ncbi:hypothetical protein GCM10027517_05870 [Phycicoccus ginsengisoli]